MNNTGKWKLLGNCSRLKKNLFPKALFPEAPEAARSLCRGPGHAASSLAVPPRSAAQRSSAAAPGLCPHRQRLRLPPPAPSLDRRCEGAGRVPPCPPCVFVV